MVSGKYSALAGAISREQSIANISNNLANISTSGYKKSMVSFESILRGEKQSTDAKGINYNRIRKNFTDFSPGAVRQTDDPLDLTVNGKGFFKLQGVDGILYTRRGDFAVDSNGLLTTSNGLPVLDDADGSITLPDTDKNSIAVGDDGTLYTMGPQGTREEVARLGVATVEDEKLLKRESDTTFSLEDPTQELQAEEYRILQGSLELSNVNMATEMAKMIDGYRKFETYHKVLKSYSTISEQQNELGTLG
ncbi:MAG: flagellar basal-body rod protein FlgF [Desulfobulbaceae bacterium]|nr:flagellar basal-body rod protein FlgF [Desulfobulbaceae bacterium]